jgi:hypothetical protein
MFDFRSLMFDLKSCSLKYDADLMKNQTSDIKPQTSPEIGAEIFRRQFLVILAQWPHPFPFRTRK